MIFISRNILYLFFILIAGFVLRFYGLGEVPVGFHRDEAFLGYNAYSILKTGNDISGNFLPVHLESFLYSPAGYSYFTIPFISIFGLNEFSVRFASALFGALTVAASYFLAKEIFAGKKIRVVTALLTGFLLAISPWHINLSRVSTENTLVVFFITLGTLLIMYWAREKKKALLIGAFFVFALTLFIYQAPRAFLPLFIPLLFFINFRGKTLREYILPVILYITIIVVPIVFILSSFELSERVRMLSIFNHPETQLRLNEQIREEGASASPIVTRLFHNKVINYSATFMQNYANHFSYNFLFTDAGLPDRYRVPGFGLLYIFEIIFVFVGSIFLYKTSKRIFILLIGWILLAPIGSSFTFDDIPNLQRTLIVFPAISIVSASGIYYLWNLKFKYLPLRLFRFILVLIVVYNLLFYIHQYFVHQVNHRPWFRQEGYKELYAKLDSNSEQYKKIYITDAQTAPFIFYLFYNRYDPAKLQEIQNKIDWDKHSLVFGKYIFGQDCPLHTDTKTDSITGMSIKYLRFEKDALYVNSGICPDEPEYIETLAEIARNDGTVVFKMVEPVK